MLAGLSCPVLLTIYLFNQLQLSEGKNPISKMPSILISVLSDEIFRAATGTVGAAMALSQ
jgi:hypothetical protein